MITDKCIYGYRCFQQTSRTAAEQMFLLQMPDFFGGWQSKYRNWSGFKLVGGATQERLRERRTALTKPLQPTKSKGSMQFMGHSHNLTKTKEHKKGNPNECFCT